MLGLIRDFTFFFPLSYNLKKKTKKNFTTITFAAQEKQFLRKMPASPSLEKKKGKKFPF